MPDSNPKTVHQSELQEIIPILELRFSELSIEDEEKNIVVFRKGCVYICAKRGHRAHAFDESRKCGHACNSCFKCVVNGFGFHRFSLVSKNAVETIFCNKKKSASEICEYLRKPYEYHMKMKQSSWTENLANCLMYCWEKGF